MNDICLCCNRRPKRENYQFCSRECTRIAAQDAPRLIRVPKGHVMYNDVKKSFEASWESDDELPRIALMFLITWTREMRTTFDEYRDLVAQRSSPIHEEVKRFRGERRACRLGEQGNTEPCKRSSCNLCVAIRTAFKSSLDHKREMVQRGSHTGVRFGGGIYMAPSSSKAYDYAKNIGETNSSQYHALLCVRTVLGSVQTLHSEEHWRLAPDSGYDSVQARSSPNDPMELIVYDEDAVRPAYLILLK